MKQNLLPKLPVALAAAVLTLACIVLLCLCVHPTDPAPAGTTAAKAEGFHTDLAARLDPFANNTASTALDGLTYIRKIYTLEPDALSGPKPDPANYGRSKDPAEVSAVVARASELLDGQSLCWNPELELRPDSEIRWYYDETILVLAWQEVHNNAVYNYAEVKIAHPSQFRRFIAGNSYGASVQLPSTAMSAAANAVISSNGDFYAFRGTGVNVYQGTLYRCDNKLLDTCMIDRSGDLLCLPVGFFPDDAAAQSFIEEHGVSFSLAFGPTLVTDGVAITSTNYPIGEPNQIYARSAVGQLDSLHYLLMTCGEAGIYKNAATVVQAAAEMAAKGCRTAYALDGGQTAEIVMGGEIFNRVVYDSERAVSDIIYFATAIPEEGGAA